MRRQCRIRRRRGFAHYSPNGRPVLPPASSATPRRILFFAFHRVFRAAGEGLLRAPDRGHVVLAGLSEGPIVFGGYTVYDYVLRARAGRTLDEKVLKIRLVPYACVTSAHTGVMKRAALRPGVLPAVGIPVMNPLAAISGSMAGCRSSRRTGPFIRGFVTGRSMARRPGTRRALVLRRRR